MKKNFVFANKKQVVADEALVRFWGKPLSERDALICKSLGFAESDSQGSKKTWRLSEYAKAFPGQVHINGAIMEPRVDQAIEEWTLNNLIGALDVFFGTNGREIHLRLVLTLIHLTLENLVTFEMRGCQPWLTSTVKLREALAPADDLEEFERQNVEQGFLARVFLDGEWKYAVTPKGLFGGPFAEQADLLLGGVAGRGLKLFQALEARKLLKRDGDGWKPTAFGEEFGLTGTSEMAADLIEKLGLEDLVQ